MYTLDTNTIIYCLRREERTINALREIMAREYPLYVSTITELELFSFKNLPSQEARAIEDFLASTVIIPVDSRIARAAGALRSWHPGLKTPDSVIAATAMLNHSILATRNIRDFSRIDTLRLLEV